jgi:hypothetical protein
VEFDYSGIDSLTRFTGTHPQVMKERIARINWKFEHDIAKKNVSLKNHLLQSVENIQDGGLGNTELQILS